MENLSCMSHLHRESNSFCGSSEEKKCPLRLRRKSGKCWFPNWELSSSVPFSPFFRLLFYVRHYKNDDQALLLVSLMKCMCAAHRVGFCVQENCSDQRFYGWPAACACRRPGCSPCRRLKKLYACWPSSFLAVWKYSWLRLNNPKTCMGRKKAFLLRKTVFRRLGKWSVYIYAVLNHCLARYNCCFPVNLDL